MDKIRELFLNIPDIVVITDAYGYILDFNRKGPFDILKKGKKITQIYPGFMTNENEISCKEYIFKPQVSSTQRAGKISGYTIIFSDVTEEEKISTQIQRRNDELDLLTDSLKEGNEKTEILVSKIKEISEYDEQLRIARSIHDDSGHVITEIHTICQMCLKLKNIDIKQYHEMISEGIRLCKNALSKKGEEEYSSIRDIIDKMTRTSQFPVESSIEGDEPSWAARLYPIFARILKEAYHNTLDHSLADKLFVKVRMTKESITLNIQDNGKFRGTLEKGFGLLAMEDYVSKSGGKVDFLAEEGKGFGITASWGTEK